MVNKAIIVGNLGRDPELQHTSSGSAVTRLSVATTRKWKNKQTGESQEETEWHRVTVWGAQAEPCSKFLSKGRKVYVEGRIRTTKYEKDGMERYSTEIVADTVQFLDSRLSQPAEAEPQSAPRESSQSAPVEANSTPLPADDDIPF